MVQKDLARNNLYMKMVVNILRAGKIIDYKVSEVLKDFTITHIQFNILRILEAEHPQKLSLGEVADGLLFPTSDVSRIIDRLVVRGLINREFCPDDRRKLELSLTSAGQEVIDKALPRIEKSLNGYYQPLINETDRNKVIEIMRLIR
jgi:DNA-binding MarR family transcriptional regulator